MVFRISGAAEGTELAVLHRIILHQGITLPSTAFKVAFMSPMCSQNLVLVPASLGLVD
jgi:hypothetical protein